MKQVTGRAAVPRRGTLGVLAGTVALAVALWALHVAHIQQTLGGESGWWPGTETWGPSTAEFEAQRDRLVRIRTQRMHVSAAAGDRG